MEFINKELDLIPKFKTEGGGWAEDLALQNIQARIRMVMSYLMASVISMDGSVKKKDSFL